MPLENDLWSLGKCGFKILQYMGAGIPVVASPIGVNKEIIQDGKNGYLANNNDEWFRKIENLILNENIRSEFSTEGFKTLEKKYNLEIEKLKFVENINKINQKISGISLFEYKSEKTTIKRIKYFILLMMG